MRRIVEDPDVYKSSDIARKNGRIRKAQNEIADALATLKDYERNQIETSRGEFKSTEEFDALDAEAQVRLDDIFDRAQRELEVARGAYEIKGFASSFVERNTGAILAVLNPPKQTAQTSEGNSDEHTEFVKPQVQSVTVADVCKRVPGSPLIKNEEDIDSYLDGLRALLVDEIRSGKVVVK